MHIQHTHQSDLTPTWLLMNIDNVCYNANAKFLTCSLPVSVSLQWINSRTLVLVDSHEKLQVVDRPSQEVLETLDLEQVQLVYNSRHFKSLATGGNVSQALVRD